MSNTNGPRLLTGVAGLDQILDGGLIPQQTYLIKGGPGTGKTTLGIHFLTADSGSESLFITLGETEEQLRSNAKRVGLRMDSVVVLDVSPSQMSKTDGNYNLLESWDAEGNAIHDHISKYVREHRPRRILIDSLSQMRYLSADIFQFRKQILSLLQTLVATGATVLFTSEESERDDEQTLPFLGDGVISLEATECGRLCHITKEGLNNCRYSSPLT